MENNNTNANELSYDLKVQLSAFCRWAQTENVQLKSKDGYDLKASSLDQLKLRKLNAAAKTKLSAYLKAVMKEYMMFYNGQKLEKPNDIVKKFKSKAILVDRNIDTNDTEYLITLDCNKEALEKAFGNAVVTCTDEKWSTEWKILINGRTYSIYDWKTCEGWHLAGKRKNKKETSLVNEYLTKWTKLDSVDDEIQKENHKTPTEPENKVKDTVIVKDTQNGTEDDADTVIVKDTEDGAEDDEGDEGEDDDGDEVEDGAEDDEGEDGEGDEGEDGAEEGAKDNDGDEVADDEFELPSVFGDEFDSGDEIEEEEDEN